MLNRIKLFFLLLLLFTGVNSFAGESRDPYQYFFNETFNDFSEELQTAREEGKKGIFLFFEMDECPFCHRMKTTVLNQPEVQKYFRKYFLNFPVDIEGDVEMVNFKGKHKTQKMFSEKENRVRATPVLAFFDLNGKRIFRYTGATASVKEFMWMGEFIVEGYYKKMRFIKFKRMKRKLAGS